MKSDRWEVLSEWHNAWLAADAEERERLHATFLGEHPELAEDAAALAASSLTVGGFLETPAIIENAHQFAQDDEPLSVGSMVGPYRIVALLARGGMGDVYRSTDVRLRRDVALKILARSPGGDVGRVERFVREAQVTASLDHPNVVRVYDVGLSNGRAYFVAELLDGETLRARLGSGPLPYDDVRRITSDVARGLIAAHTAGLVHRDLKPENIFLSRSGSVKILDFGIAKIEQDIAASNASSTITGVVLGTAAYLSPEQIRGNRVDARTDLFAFGSVIFEMLTGRRAFERVHLVGTLHAILHEPPDTRLEHVPEIPPAFAGVVTRLLAKEPERRFQSAGDLLAVVQGLDSDANAMSSSRPTAADVLVPAAHEPHSRRRSWLRVGIVLSLLVSAIAMGWRFSPFATTPVVGNVKSLAVFPFRTLPAGADDDLLEIGLAEVLISRTGRMSGVRVLPLSAMARLPKEDPQSAGRQLGADYVLTGSLQRDQGRLRATVQLWSSKTNAIVWSDSFDRDEDSVFTVQDAIVGRVLGAIAPHVAPEVQNRLARAGTRHNEAFEAYLHGRALASRPNVNDLRRAIEFFRTAVAHDDQFADAWAWLAVAQRMLPIALASDARPREALAAAATAAERALQLEPDHPEALAAQGMIAFHYDWDYVRAERLIRQALALQTSPQSHLSLAHLLSNLGRHEEALAEIQRARSLDPAWPIARALEGQFLFMARRYREALDRLDSVVAIDPDFPNGHVMRTYPLLALGRYADALPVYDRVDGLVRGGISDQPFTWAVALRGYALAKLGRQKEAEMILAQLRAAGREGYVPPHHEALLLHALGRNAEALEQLREAVEARDVFVTFLGVDPKWDDLRGTPAFTTLLSRANLLDVSQAIVR